MEQINAKKVLFIGIGGGNDVFSTVLARESLKNLGHKWDSADIAGVLSPFHKHSNLTEVATRAFKINSNSERFVVRNDGEIKLGFIDATVAKMIESGAVPGIGRVLGLELYNGSVGLERTFSELSETYDYFVLVDLGGDCFYRDDRDWHVLSPMFDAMVIQGFCDSKVKGILFEAGPGSDGEIDPEPLSKFLSQPGVIKYPLDDSCVNSFESLYQNWIEPVRTGRTVPVTIAAYRSKEKEIRMTYRARAHLGDKRIYSEFEQRINTDLCKNFYLIDPIKILWRNPFIVKCGSPLMWFLLTQMERLRSNCEVNLEYIRDEFVGRICQFLTPSPLFSEPDRMKIIEIGLTELCQGCCDSAWMFLDDWRRVSEKWTTRLEVLKTPYSGELCLVWSPKSKNLQK